MAEIVGLLSLLRKIVRFTAEGQQRGQLFSGGLSIKDDHMDRFTLPWVKRTILHHRGNPPHRPDEDSDRFPRGFLQLPFDPLLQLRGILFQGLEDHISGLDVGLHILQPK